MIRSVRQELIDVGRCWLIGSILNTLTSFPILVSHERFSWTVLVYPLNSLLVPSHFSIETRPRRWQQMSLRCAGILLSLLISPGLAFPAHLPSHHTKRREDVNFLNFQPKGPNDVRSPCPAMNAYAHLLNLLSLVPI